MALEAGRFLGPTVCRYRSRRGRWGRGYLARDGFAFCDERGAELQGRGANPGLTACLGLSLRQEAGELPLALGLEQRAERGSGSVRIRAG